MKITQISIFLENHAGRLHEVTALLGREQINIRALTVAESRDFGVLRIVTDQPDRTLTVLKAGGFVASLTEIVAVEVSDTPGGLSGILGILSENKVNVEYMYGFVEKHSEKALLVFRFDNTDKAIEVLTRSNINVVGKKEIETL
ncbi:MAG: ACT domain-containing protein [Candidatus Omnitrophica bacterium]|nr:ACT domain-containing protein [Candidatus Omnitrophota bacterium]